MELEAMPLHTIEHDRYVLVMLITLEQNNELALS